MQNKLQQELWFKFANSPELAPFRFIDLERKVFDLLASAQKSLDRLEEEAAIQTGELLLPNMHERKLTCPYCIQCCV